MTPVAAARIVVLDRDADEARHIAGWLRSAGLGMISTARTSDEAIFMLGSRGASLLIIDDSIASFAEQRLLQHLADCDNEPPPIVRLVGAEPVHPLGAGHAIADALQKPLTAYDVVVRVGQALQRTDLIGRMDRDRDQSAEHLDAARRMQRGLLPTAAQIADLQAACGIGLDGFCRPGEAVGGDFWGAWATGRGRFALAVADFAGHGLSAALNTFRLHAILSEQTLPRGLPRRMNALLNQRLHSLLPRGHYATMIYALIEPAAHRIVWSSAGGPDPIFVTPGGSRRLAGRGLPLGVRPGTPYRSHAGRLAGPGILCLFSDGLTESGPGASDVPHQSIVDALAGPVQLAAAGQLGEATRLASWELEQLRDRHAAPNHSDDVLAVCVALGPESHPPAA